MEEPSLGGAGVAWLPPNRPGKDPVFEVPKGANGGNDGTRFSTVVRAVVDVVVVFDVLFVGGAALVVVVVVASLDVMFRSIDSFVVTVVPCVVVISVVVSVETRFSFMSTVVFVISNVGPTVVVSSDRDDASVDDVDVVVMVVVTVGSTDEDGMVVVSVEDTGKVVESVVGAVTLGTVVVVVVVVMVSVVCSGWMILEPAVPWAVVVDVVSCKRAIRFGISLTRSVSI